MVDVKLKFDIPRDTSRPVDLFFGTPIKPREDSSLTLLASFPVPRMSASIGKIITMSLQSRMPMPVCKATIDYDNSTMCRMSGQSNSAWQPHIVANSQTTDRIENVTQTHTFASDVWSLAGSLSGQTEFPVADCNPIRHTSTLPWAQGYRVASGVGVGFVNLTPSRWGIGAKSNDAIGLRCDTSSLYLDLSRFPRPTVSTEWSAAKGLVSDHLSKSGVAKPLSMGDQSYWQFCRKPQPGKSVVPPIVVPPKDGCYTPPLGSKVDLLFSGLFSKSADLLFRCENYVPPPGAAIIVPVRRSYIVMNDVHLKRVEGNHDLNATSLSLSIDMDSWTWSFSASLPASSLSLVKPGMSGDPVLLVANINGNEYLVLAEGIQRNRSFGKSSITVTGRGQSAALADPYSQILSFSNTVDRTAQQLMNDTLTINGVPLGWAVDWRIDDWLVPAGAWNHRGSYMSAVTAIAAAAGAFVQPDPANKILRIRPRYPVKPWEWNAATPDLQLPSAVVVNESIAWVDKPAYNAVYVSGATTGGVLGHVKRTGSAGDLVAPMVTDALITDAIAARQRGTYILADTGKMAQYSLSLPVLPETGIIVPGTMVRYVDDGPIIGVIKGVSANASTTSVRQTIEVQTHG